MGNPQRLSVASDRPLITHPRSRESRSNRPWLHTPALEVGRPVARFVGVAPEADRHRRGRTRHDELALRRSHRLPLLIGGVDGRAKVPAGESPRQPRARADIPPANAERTSVPPPADGPDVSRDHQRRRVGHGFAVAKASTSTRTRSANPNSGLISVTAGRSRSLAACRVVVVVVASL